ncbi:MAG: ABC transporter permease [Candidatus Acidiferrales bacterium]
MKQDIQENLALAFDTLRSHKARSFLAVLGVVIGVGVIIVVASLITGFRSTISDEIAGFGANTVWVARYDQGPRMSSLPANERMRPPLTLDQGLGLLSQCPAIKDVAISVYQWQNDHIATFGRNQVDALDMSGETPSYMEVYGNANLQAGRFFSDAENSERAKVVIFGEDAAKALFPSVQDAVGKTVSLDGSDFRVIGVFETPKGGFGFDSEDKRAIVPYNTLHEMYPQALDNGYRFVAYPGQLDEAVDEARGVLRRERKVPYNAPDSFSITTQVQQEEQFNQIIGGVALVLIVLSSIGLLIGGVGVMNIMLVSVTERTREIGIRKAIGARSRDITWQFLFEAMTLTGAGGIFGVALFSGLAMLIPHVTSMKASVPIWAIIVGIAVSVGIGLIFGVWPAVKAAKLDPIDALRYE